jgi:hypothetical protein
MCGVCDVRGVIITKYYKNMYRYKGGGEKAEGGGRGRRPGEEAGGGGRGRRPGEKAGGEGRGRREGREPIHMNL